MKFIAFCILLMLLVGISYNASSQRRHLVISQVYSGGGDSASSYNNGYIEIFNPTGSKVDLRGWSVQYANASSTSWRVTPLKGVIPPGTYVLIQEGGSGHFVGIPLPLADISDTINLAGPGGKVLLLNSTSKAIGACPSGASVIDFVGYGSATCYEGSAAATRPNQTQAVFRSRNGYTDSDNNSSDFAIGLPSPRNSATPIVYPNPVKLVSTLVNASTAYKGKAMAVKIESQDENNIPQKVLSTTYYTISAAGTTLGATVFDSLVAGSSSKIDSVVLTTQATAAVLNVAVTTGDILSQAKTDSFKVLSQINTDMSSTAPFIGIGTLVPTAQLHTTGSVRLAGLQQKTIADSLAKVIAIDSVGNLSIVPQLISAKQWIQDSVGNISNVNPTSAVGIGTASPKAQLHTTGSVRFAGLRKKIIADSLKQVVAIDSLGNLSKISLAAETTKQWIMDSLGNVSNTNLTAAVGIGTKTPTAQLHTTGTVRFSGLKKRLATDSSYTITIDSLGNLSVGPPIPIILPPVTISPQQWITVDSSGNMYNGNPGPVGIGTSELDPNAQLTVSGNIYTDGAVAIGPNINWAIVDTSANSANPTYLVVNGGAVFNKVTVKISSNRTFPNTAAGSPTAPAYYWPDYVFDNGYSLPPLRKVEEYIKKYKHLPEVISAKDAEENGIDLGNNQTVLLKKVEELTLYMIEMNKNLNMMKKEIGNLKDENHQLKTKLLKKNKG